MKFNLTKIEQGRIEPPLTRAMKKKEEELNRAEIQEVMEVSQGLAIKEKFDEYLAKTSRLEREAEALVIKTDEDREVAANIAAGAKKLVRAIDERRKEITGPAESFCKAVKAVADKFADRLKAAARIASDKELAFVQMKEMARREAEKLAKEAAAKLQAEIDKEAQAKGIEAIKVEAPIVPEPKTTARTEAGVTSFTVKTWDFEVIDDSDVPRQFCSADPRKIREAIKNGVREIRGCRIFEKVEIRHRT